MMKKIKFFEFNSCEKLSQNFIFFVTYEWAHGARELHNIRLERLTKDQQFSLLGLFLSYKENELF
jgi:hypothetical protein